MNTAGGAPTPNSSTENSKGFRFSFSRAFHLSSLGFDVSSPHRASQGTSLRIFQRFRLVKFMKKFKTRVKNLKVEKIIAFDKYLHELFFPIYFHLTKHLLLTLKNNEVVDLTHFSTKCVCF